jgi:hypothetical protein
VLGTVGETGTTQENNQDWLELYEGDARFQLLTEEKIAAVIFFIYFHHTTCIVKFNIYFWSKFFFPPFRAILCFINPDWQWFNICGKRQFC